ncbi:putative N-acetyltransferase 5 [Ceraceosorus guamensis]|uniref:Putative N-acetyltransferase 5 n=1 Tax=Ceraceosorus guamensis TaxID=1522189 RepID=A0A316VV73_9BASI|nr:putative N-acetyltransferase 5 [Ceraceosorus guamensis]PWN41527.1 putative N-acetyltransferase 5 [Ceraceosorus guamensis]
MSLLTPFRATDLFKFNQINLDHWTETYSLSFYLTYISKWPELCYTQYSSSSGGSCNIKSAARNGASLEGGHASMMGYVIGKAEGRDTGMERVKERHGHVTAITVAPEFRRLGVAKGLMNLLEDASEKVYNSYFVDLFVRPSNNLAVSMYEKLGYEVYRTVDKYYSGGGAGGTDENGWDMRKALSRDKKRETARDGKKGRTVVVNPEDTWFEPARRPRP